MTTKKSGHLPSQGSYGGPNLTCADCGKSFYSESAKEMAGRPCVTADCRGMLSLLDPAAASRGA
jgi:hypothetical protein